MDKFYEILIAFVLFFLVALIYEHFDSGEILEEGYKKYKIEYYTPLCQSCFNFHFDITALKLCPSYGYGVVKKERNGNRYSWTIACKDSWGWYDKM